MSSYGSLACFALCYVEVSVVDAMGVCIEAGEFLLSHALDLVVVVGLIMYNICAWYIILYVYVHIQK